MFENIKRKIAKWALNSYAIPESSDKTLLDVSDEYLKRATAEHSRLMSVAQRINRGKILNAQTKELKQIIKEEADDEEEEEEADDEEEEKDDFADQLLKDVISKVLNKNSQLPNTNQSQSSAPSKYREILNNMSDDQLEEMAKKLGF